MSTAMSRWKASDDPVGYGSSFMAGFYPTGIHTFRLAQKAKRHTGHQLAGFAGGVLGGLTIIPSTVSAAIDVGRNWQKIRSAPGLGGKAALLGGTILKGLVSPYKTLYQGQRARNILGKAMASKRALTSGEMAVLKDAYKQIHGGGELGRINIRNLIQDAGSHVRGAMPPVQFGEMVDLGASQLAKRAPSMFRHPIQSAALRFRGRIPASKGLRDVVDRAVSGFQRVAPNQVTIPEKIIKHMPAPFRNKLMAGAHEQLSREVINSAAALGAAGALGGGSALLQYHQGSKVGDRLRRVGVDV